MQGRQDVEGTSAGGGEQRSVHAKMLVQANINRDTIKGIAIVVHVSWANASFRVLRKVRESELVTGRRSFAEVVGLSQNQSEECINAYSEPIARVPLWMKEARSREAQEVPRNGKTGAGVGCLEKTKKAGTGHFPVLGTWNSGKVMGHEQTLAKTGDGAKVVMMKDGDGLVTALGLRDPGKAAVCAELAGRSPACTPRRPVTSSTLSKTLNSSISEKSELERLIGREELVGDGQPTSSVHMELLAIKRVLTGLKSEVEGGIKRMDSALGLLGFTGPKVDLLGASVSQVHTGDPGAQPYGPKPKKNKKNKKKNKKSGGVEPATGYKRRKSGAMGSA
ncbi:hypothetical protein FH972_007164 [Carpinus fangiana]|uniref:Uncharacterized protein n=1 Tax=Carpinus fangiana TaxID=176857 RepID=A0A5N6QUI6_9ROSI|nr:hypothetical protein FH972_007164 [Carpinus fangiana]